MGQRAHIPTPYETLEALPPGVVGELVNGQVHAHPRPSARHARVALTLGADLLNAYDRGTRGPGGWWIIGEPELHFVRDAEVLVPDIAGWQRERMPQLPDDQRFTVAPGWICEILSPSTASYDREVKLPVYAWFGVPHVWLIDLRDQRVEVLTLSSGEYTRVAAFEADEPIQAPPFDGVRLEPVDLWA